MGFLDKLLGRAKGTASDVADKAAPVVEKTHDLADQAADKSHDLADQAADKASDLVDRAKDAGDAGDDVVHPPATDAADPPSNSTAA